MKKIELVGFDKITEEVGDVAHIRDVALENMKISDVGEIDAIKKLIPGAMNLYLDKNLLYSWDQYFAIIK